MSSSIFSTQAESFPLAHILYVGYMHEIPEDKRKGNNTHSFKLLTTSGVFYCNFSDPDTANKSHSVVTRMMNETKVCLFKNGKELLDSSKVSSFSKVLPLKKTDNGFTHALIVTLDMAADDKTKQVWFHYKSEDAARNARKALYALIMSLSDTGEPAEQELEATPA